MTFKVLTDAQAAHFVEKGYVKIEGCFEKAEIQDWLDLAYLRLGYDRDDPTTWIEDRIHMPSMNRRAVADLAPKAWDGICDVMGGAEAHRRVSLRGEMDLLLIFTKMPMIPIFRRQSGGDGTRMAIFSGIFWIVQSRGC